MSQLALAAEAEVSARHLCFLETGRARPSREMVHLLARALDASLSDRNALLLAAGYAPAYAERALDAPELRHVRRAFDFILERQEPYPAIVVDGGWNTVLRNEATVRIFGLFLAGWGPGLDPQRARNAMHLICHPDGLRRFIVNWEEFAGPLIQAIHREATAGHHVAALRDALLAYPGMPAAWRVPDSRTPPPVLTMRLKKGDLSLAFFSTLTILATPRDVTLEQLRIECFYPADPQTEEIAHRLAGRRPAAS